MDVGTYSQLGKLRETLVNKGCKFCEGTERYANDKYMIYE